MSEPEEYQSLPRIGSDLPNGDEGKNGNVNCSSLSRKISWTLDDCIQVPGTSFSFGLDPILGLLPYGGETVTAAIGATIIGEAVRKGLPMKTLLQMSGNMLLNALVGTIPLIGDIFSAWFKSNTRNYKLLKAYTDSEEGEEASGGWKPFLVVFGSVALVLILNLLAWIGFTTFIFRIYQSAVGLAT